MITINDPVIARSRHVQRKQQQTEDALAQEVRCDIISNTEQRPQGQRMADSRLGERRVML